MKELKRITWNPSVMGGKPCIRGMRITVGTIVGLVAVGTSKEDILKLYPYLPARGTPHPSHLRSTARVFHMGQAAYPPKEP